MIPKLNYSDKTFEDFNISFQKLIKDYYPDNYKDFTPSSIGNIFKDLLSYTGDVLSFSIDTNIQENFPTLAKEKRNLYRMSYFFGYTPKLISPSTTIISVSQIIPKHSNGNYPDLNYSLIIPKYTEFISNQGIKFYNKEDIYFFSPKNRKIEQIDANNFKITKNILVTSGEIKTITHTVENTEDYYNIKINDSNFIKIISITDQNNNNYGEFKNQTFNYNSFELGKLISNGVNSFKWETENIPIPKKYSVFVEDNNEINIIFGTKSHNFDLIKNNYKFKDLINSFDEDVDEKTYFYLSNTIHSNGPLQDDVITIKYLSSKGFEENIPAFSINDLNINNITILNGSDNNINSNILSNLEIIQKYPSIGGGLGDTIKDLRNNIQTYFLSPEKKLISKGDIIKNIIKENDFLNLSKYYVDEKENITKIYLLYKDNNGNFLRINDEFLNYVNQQNEGFTFTTTNNNSTLNTLKNYTKQGNYIDLLSPFIINIEVNFEISVLSGFNHEEIIKNVIYNLKQYFHNDNMEINQPLYIGKINNIILQTKGVQNINSLKINNISGDNYSEYSYDIKGATKDNIIYPSKDIMIFEVKYPDIDIKGKTI